MAYLKMFMMGAYTKTFQALGGFLASDSNISLLGNTDGVALIRSTGNGVWPVFLVINVLSPLQSFFMHACLFYVNIFL